MRALCVGQGRGDEKPPKHSTRAYAYAHVWAHQNPQGTPNTLESYYTILYYTILYYAMSTMKLWLPGQEAGRKNAASHIDNSSNEDTA